MQSGDTVENGKATLAPYEYVSSLSSSYFRLLIVEGGGKDAPIIASLRTTSHLPGQTAGILQTLSSVVLGKEATTIFEWDAISYAWEGQKPSETILVGGQELKVTLNVMRIIKDLRRPDQRTVLWIDAICINQANPEEKSFQVSIMSSIYQNAKRVVIWLGPETFFDKDRTGAALDAVSWLNSKRGMGSRESLSLGERPQFENLFDCYKREMNSNSEEVLSSLSGNISQSRATPVDSPVDSPFETAVQCSWFRRIWVVQEAVLAKFLVVQVGSRWVHWGEFAIAALRFLTNAEADIALKLDSDECYTQCFQQQHSLSTKSGISMIYLIETLRKWVRSSAYPIAPSELALMCKNCEATIPNDMIYAIIGLFGLKDTLSMTRLKVNYELSAPEVYKDFVTWCIREERSLDILAQQRYDYRRVKPSPTHRNFPSWATNWSRGRALNFNTTETNPLGGRLKHGKRELARHIPIDTRKGDTLIVKGFMIDTIKKPAPLKLYYDHDSQQEWMDAISENQEQNLILFPSGPQSTLKRTIAKFPDMPYLWRDGATLSIPRSTKFTRTHFTEKGCLAVAFAHMSYGNKPKVCALYGGRALFILQPILDDASDTPLYNLVCGDCFIEGFEDGKGIQKAKELGLQEMDFHIV